LSIDGHPLATKMDCLPNNYHFYNTMPVWLMDSLPTVAIYVFNNGEATN